MSISTQSEGTTSSPFWAEKGARRRRAAALLPVLAAGAILFLMACQPSVAPGEVDPGGENGGAGADAEYLGRHQDFSRGSVQLLGAIEGVRLADRHRLEEARGQFLQAVAEAAGALLDRHEGFPPHPSTLREPDKIVLWQDAMSGARSAASAIADPEEDSEAAGEVAKLLESYREALSHSGYPAGALAFLEWRGTFKAARDLDPDQRLALADEIVARLAEGRDRFVAERRPLMLAEDLPEFDRRAQALLDQQSEAVREAGPIPDSTEESLHRQYPYFHHPDALDPLLERERSL